MNLHQGTTGRPAGRPREFDIDKALDEAIIVFTQKGYHGTSISELGQAMKLTAGSLYKAFKDKHAIFLAAFDRYKQVRNALLEEELRPAADGRDGVRRILTFYAGNAYGEAGRRGCLAVGTAVELATFDNEAASRVKRSMDGLQHRFEDMIRRGHADGSIPAGVEPKTTARSLLALVQGVRVLGKTSPGREEALIPSTAVDAPAAPAQISAGLTIVMAAACGLVVANLYYAQPLAGPIAAAIGLPPHLTGLIVTLTQIGYGLGLLFVVPLGDLIENRRLIVTMIGAVTIALLAAGLSTAALPFLLASLAIGLASTAVQMIVPFAANLAPEEHRGRVVGNVMSGLMIGIMLARPVASFITGFSSWHTVFFLSAAVMVVLAFVMAARLPKRLPHTRLSYGGLILSLGKLYATQPVLRRRAFYQFCQFACFSLFWTVTPLVLAGPAFHLGQSGIAIFALVGVAGAIASPIAGRLADRDLSRPATVFGILAVGGAFLITHLAPEGSTLALLLLGLAAIALDFGVSMTLVIGQRAIYGLGAELRSRLNGLFMATFFVGGALGSAVGAWAFAEGGWLLASGFGVALSKSPTTSHKDCLVFNRTGLPMRIDRLLLALCLATIASPLAAADPVGVRKISVVTQDSSRPLAVTVWYPAAAAAGTPAATAQERIFEIPPASANADIRAGRFPLVLLSHGSGSRAEGMAWIAVKLAQAGFVVAGPNHPGTTSGDSTPAATPKIWERTSDLSVLIGAFSRDRRWQASIDHNRIGVLGFSLGGSTALELAGARPDLDAYVRYCEDQPGMMDCSWFAGGRGYAGGELVEVEPFDLRSLDRKRFEQDNRDPRVTAVVAVDPGLAGVMKAESLRSIAVPLALINLGGPGEVPPAVLAEQLARDIPGATYAQVPGANHYSFLPVCRAGASDFLRSVGETDPICEESLRPRADIHADLARIIVSAFERSLKPIN
eukprot:g25352.t1